MTTSWALCVLAITAASPCGAQPRFSEIGADRGIGAYVMDLGMGGGVAAADFDDDGDVDLFVPNAGGVADQLYRNLGSGTYEEIAAAAGLASFDRGRVALWVDYDGDRRLDLFVAADCLLDAADCPGLTPLRLYRQVGDAEFEDVTLAAGIDTVSMNRYQQQGGMSAGDVDNDGDLDLLTGVWSGKARLYLNRGGSFEEIGAASGLGASGFHWQPVMHDFDGDRRLDVFAAVDFDPNHLWLNRGDRTFVDVAAAAGTDNAWNDMGVALGDVDNDGDLDVYVTNIWEWQPGRRNLLLMNESKGRKPAFTRVVDGGVENGGWGWGTTFLDADNDGDLDLAATNGWIEGERWIADPSRLFLNQGGDPPRFVDVSTAAGFDDTLWGSSLVAADLDRDGDLDLVQTTNGWGSGEHRLRLLDNRPEAPGHYLVVRPRMGGANHRAIGAVVRVKVGGRRMMRLITAGTSFLGQEPAEAFFGVGEATVIDRVTIEWPGLKKRSSLTRVAADQVLTVDAPRPGRRGKR